MPSGRSPTSPRISRKSNNRYEDNVANGPTVFGDKRPGRFLEDVSKGVDSLDIIIMSDSNACSALYYGGYGWNEGMPAALNSLNLPIYGTGFMYSHHRGTQGSDGFYSFWRGVSPSFTATSGSTNYTLGSTAAGDDAAAFQPFWNSPAQRTGYASIENADWTDWTFVPNTGNDLFSVRGITLFRGHPLTDTGLTVKYRAVLGKTVSGTGRVYCNYWQAGPINAQTRTVPTGSLVSMNVAAGTAAADRITKAEWSFVPPSLDGFTVGVYGGDVSGVNFTRGPFAMLGHSLYTNRKGWAVHTHHHGSGRTSAQIATACTDSSSRARLAAELKEMYDRQIAAGGTGRVMLFLNFGVNGPDSGPVWETAVRQIWDYYKSVWASLGLPLNNLCVVATVSHVQGPAGNATETALSAARAHANRVPFNYRDITVVDLSVLAPYNYLAGYSLGGIPFYQAFNGYPSAADNDSVAHLSGGQCEVLTVTGTTPTTTASSITLTGSAAKAQDNYWTGGFIEIQTINGSANSPAYQTVFITKYNGTTKVATVGSWMNGQQPTSGATINYNIRRASHSDGYAAVSRMILSSLMAAT